MMRTFKTGSLNFQICSGVLLTITMLYITSPGLIYYITGSLYLLTPGPISFLHTSPLHNLALGNHQSTLCIYELSLSFISFF